MRLIIKSMLALLVVASLALFILPLKNGAPLLKWSELKMPNGPKLPELPDIELFKERGQEPTTTPVTSYKWQDAEGNWHLSDSPPQDTSYQTVTVNPDTNVVQATRAAPVVAAPPPAVAERPEAQPTYSPAMAYDPEQVTEVMDSARNVDKLLQQRKEQQDQLLKAIE